MDAHVFGKNTLSLYRSLFSFTNVLIICVGERTIPTDKMFESCHAFLSKGVNPNAAQLNNKKLSADFRWQGSLYCRYRYASRATGKTKKQEHRSKISKTMTGRTLSDEHRLALKKAWQRRKTMVLNTWCIRPLYIFTSKLPEYYWLTPVVAISQRGTTQCTQNN